MVPTVFTEKTGGESSERNAGSDSSGQGTLGCVSHRTKVHLAVCQLHRNRGHSVQSAAVMSLHYYSPPEAWLNTAGKCLPCN